jgi:hypothetical protein
VSDAIHFSAIPTNAPNRPTCPLCTEKPVEFEFHFSNQFRPMEQLRGRCCLSCAASLLDAMLALTSAEEEQFLSDHSTPRCVSKYVN